MSEAKCPRCGGPAIKAGFKVTKEGRRQRYQCKQCGHVFALPSLPAPESPAHRGGGRRWEDGKDKKKS